VLREAGAWRQVERQRLCPYRRMIVEDRDERTRLEFDAPEFGLERLGTIVENDLVQWALWQSLLATGGVEIACPEQVEALEEDSEGRVVVLRSGARLRCRLLVAADGTDSEVRKLLGIRQDQWEYGQMGVVGVVRTVAPNPGLAWQRFLEGGPLAFLPLQNGDSSIVWSRPRPRPLYARSGGGPFLRSCRLPPAAQAWPRWPAVGRARHSVTTRLSDRYHARGACCWWRRAHVVHPLAGERQSRLLDAAALAEILVVPGGAGGLPRTRTWSVPWRRSEAEIMARGIHGIRGLFMAEELGLLRRLGLGLVSRSWTAKEAFIRRATGRNRAAPALARGVALTELLQY
jgi:2-octaprenyl-3-methyl-6-methoxy-1,4-benzoquinol hydroxylase